MKEVLVMKILKAAKFESLHENAVNVCRLRTAKEEIEQEYEGACKAAIEAVVGILTENPEAVMTCGDIADATGLPISKVAYAMYNHPSIVAERQPIERRFVELDESGEPIPGCVKVEQYNRTTFRVAPKGYRRCNW